MQPSSATPATLQRWHDVYQMQATDWKETLDWSGLCWRVGSNLEAYH